MHNFIGNRLVSDNLFGLRDPSFGAAGTRSGTAKDAADSRFGADISDVNLFTYTAILIQNTANVAAADAEFDAALQHDVRKPLDQAFVDIDAGRLSTSPRNSDRSAVQLPGQHADQQRDAKIYGFEFAGQYFLGNTGFGRVGQLHAGPRRCRHRRDGAGPTVDQFALVGLSDTANATLIYDKYGVLGAPRLQLARQVPERAQPRRLSQPGISPRLTVSSISTSATTSRRTSSVSFEGINLTEEGVRTYGRDREQHLLSFAQGSSALSCSARATSSDNWLIGASHGKAAASERPSFIARHRAKAYELDRTMTGAASCSTMSIIRSARRSATARAIGDAVNQIALSSHRVRGGAARISDPVPPRRARGPSAVALLGLDARRKSVPRWRGAGRRATCRR